MELTEPLVENEYINTDINSTNYNRSEIVSNLLQRIEYNYNKRKQELEIDTENNKNVCGKVVTSNLANIPGISKHLYQMKNIRIKNASIEIPDAYGHGTLRKGELYMKYKK